MPICLINPSECGRQSGEPICRQCGMDERVVYPSVAEREAAQKQGSKPRRWAMWAAVLAHAAVLGASGVWTVAHGQQPTPRQAKPNAGPVLHGRYQLLVGGSEVKDLQTGLTWARCSVGQSWDGNSCVGEAKEFTFDQAQQQAGNGWRVPTVRELHSLVWCSTGKTKNSDDPEDGKGVIEHWCDGYFSRPTVRTDVFPSNESSYWTSSRHVGNSGNARGVDFNNGSVYGGGRHHTYAVRLVGASR